MLLVSGLLIAGCGNAPAQRQEADEPSCGGYTRQRELTEGEMEMFVSLTGTGDMTLTPVSVATQVVAGTNYRFWCMYRDEDADGHCWVVIYKPLPGQGEPEVISIQKEDLQ